MSIGRRILIWALYVLGALLVLLLLWGLVALIAPFVSVVVYAFGAIFTARWLYSNNRLRALPANRQWIRWLVLAFGAIVLIASPILTAGTLTNTNKSAAPTKPPSTSPTATSSTPSTAPSTEPSNADRAEINTPSRTRPCDAPIIPFQREEGSVKVDGNRSLIVLNGSEAKPVNAGLTLKPGQAFSVRQTTFADPKKNRVTYNNVGEAAPIWGHESKNSLVFVYDDQPPNSVLVILDANQTKTFAFRSGETSLEGTNDFTSNSKIYVHYNSVAKWNGKPGRYQCGWDGSTVTLEVTIEYPSPPTPASPKKIPPPTPETTEENGEDFPTIPPPPIPE